MKATRYLAALAVGPVVLLLALHVKSTLPPIRTSPEMAFPDSGPERLGGLLVFPSNGLSLNQV